MTPGKFLRLVWPDMGFYCIAHPFTPPGSAQTVYAHKVFPTISEAVSHIHEQANLQDVFFAVLSMREERVWDPNKEDLKTRTKGAWATRQQSNMLAGKALFSDLDVGSDPSKYATQRDALAGLLQFLTDSKLPMPTLVSSGGGVHAYWHLDRALEALEWRDLAFQLRQLAERLKLKVDPTRTIDTSSVLRVPDTYNWKDRGNPRPVKVLQEGAVTSVETIRQIISDALIRYGVTPATAPIKAPTLALPLGLTEQTFNDFGPPPTLSELSAACSQVAEILRSQGDPQHPHYGALDNTAWYRGMLGTISHVEKGDDWCRRLTALHPRTNADIDTKLLQLKTFPPARCETLAQFMPWKDVPCQTCRFRTDPSVPNPLAACRKFTVAPPPGVGATKPTASHGDGSTTSPLTGAPPPPGSPSASATTSQLIPNPPKPYERLKAGGIAVTRKDKDDNETTTVIYAHDLYPLKRLVNADASTEQQVWRVTLPRSGARDFTIDADVLYDARKFAAALSHNGIYPHKADLPALQDYMVAYISQLQKELDADAQVGHLGWTDGYRRFVLPDKTLLEDGGILTSALTDGAVRATAAIGKRGDMAKQIELMGFYNHPAYIPNQSIILDSFASIIFYMTGNHGIVVNASGESGASKSTTLYTAAGIWGDPERWPINGTNRGATANARTARVVTNANLPTCVDEITHLPARDAIDLVMSITQPGHRLRLGTDGAEKAGGENYKSAIMVATANSSLHGLLSTDNAAGTAGSMRVFEMKFIIQHVHSKAQADEFLRQVRLNYGHLGEIFAQFVIRNRVAVERRVQQMVREIDVEASIASSERFWSARIASGLVAAEICQALRLLPYDPLPIRHWATKVQVPYMRGVVREEYSDPVAILTNYIAEKHGNIVVVDRAEKIGANTNGQQVMSNQAYAINTPHGSLVGHYELKANVLYLLKQTFKDHCARIGSSMTRLLDELGEPRQLPSGPRRIVVDRNCRRTLGAGTQLAKGQAYCFAIDMTHPEIAGVAPTLATVNGQAVGVPANDVAGVVS